MISLIESLPSLVFKWVFWSLGFCGNGLGGYCWKKTGERVELSFHEVLKRHTYVKRWCFIGAPWFYGGMDAHIKTQAFICITICISPLEVIMLINIASCVWESGGKDPTCDQSSLCTNKWLFYWWPQLLFAELVIEHRVVF